MVLHRPIETTAFIRHVGSTHPLVTGRCTSSPSKRMLHTMKAHQYFSPSIIAVAFFAFATVMGCSRAAPAGKQSSSEIATLNAECNLGRYLACTSLGIKYLAG